MRASSVLFVTLMLTAVVGAYKRGPPVDEHPEICGSMSPKFGHVADPQNRPLPFALNIMNTPSFCNGKARPTIVKLSSINNVTYFEGFFVQARLARSLMNNAPLEMDGIVLDGEFDPNGDRQLQTLTCGKSRRNNALGHREAKRYYEKTFTWTPPTGFSDTIQFVATVVHEKDEYWLRVTSPSVQYTEQCFSSGGQKLAVAGFAKCLAITVAVISGLQLV